MQVELKSGESYRGEMHEAEDNWNTQLKNVTATARVRDLFCCVVLVCLLSVPSQDEH